MFFQITIDGASGVGKSTLAKALSKEIDYLYINTGLIFRGLSWYLLKYQEMSIDEALTNITKHKNFVFTKNTWIFNGKPVEESELKTREVTIHSSKIAADPKIRNYALILEKEIAKYNNVIMEGRDIGTKIFPNAILKIFLKASSGIKAHRRYEELKQRGLLNGRSFQNVLEEMQERDKRDEERKICPLKKAEDAVEILSDDKSVEELVSEVKVLLTSKLNSLKLQRE